MLVSSLPALPPRFEVDRLPITLLVAKAGMARIRGHCAV
jgi:hypothetical protein